MKMKYKVGDKVGITTRDDEYYVGDIVHISKYRILPNDYIVKYTDRFGIKKTFRAYGDRIHKLLPSLD